MNAPRVALWVVGPVGSGKTTFVRNKVSKGFQCLDQDVELERQMLAHGLPLDMRTHDAAQAALLTALRRDVAKQVWGNVAGWRAAGVPLAFEVTGDKPDLLRIEVDLDRASGYLSLGVGLQFPLATCQSRNHQRPRILPDTVVESTWHAFERSVANGAYARIFGANRFRISSDPGRFDLFAWLTSFEQ